jgi:stage V sporulation protein D (sporulation-specific penicillin-binding protein)
MRRAFRFRLRILAGIILIFALFLVARLYFVQIIHGNEYSLRAERQYVSSSEQLYDRGTIYFTRKDGTLISAATIQTGFLIAIDPEDIKNPGTIYTTLSKYLPIDPTTYWNAASKTTSPYQIVVHHVDEKVGKQISDLNIPGVIINRERWRVYPGGVQAAQTLGFVAYGNDGETIAGRTGLEAQYDTVLNRSAQGLFGNFFAELFGNIQNIVVDAKSARQGDVVTSIEPIVEQKLDQEIKQINDKYHSTETGAIIMDPRTGEIIALDSYPTFDPNNFQHEDPRYFKNPIVQSRYEFGSIVKALTMASGLDAGAIQPTTVYNDTGCIHPNTTTICNYDLKARGVIPMQEILSQSLNVGASFIAGQLGHDRQREYLLKLGINQKTKIDLPGEITGDAHNLNSPRDVEHDTASFGQGIALTPVEMIRAMGALANHGAIVSPHLATGIRFETGVTKPLFYPASVQVFKQQSAEETTQMLVKVVDVKLANGQAKIPSMSVAAKTGTSQIVNPQGGYYKDVYFHSFFGYFPASNPRFIILLYTNRPQGVEYASETLTKSFLDLTHFLINYYALPPDRGPYAQTI